MAESKVIRPAAFGSPKQEMPQVGPSGVSEDYANVFWGIVGMYQIGQMESFNGLKYLQEYLRQHPMKLYQERFPLDEYKDVITAENVGRILKINEITRYLNAIAARELLSMEDLEASWRELSTLIYGTVRPSRCPFHEDSAPRPNESLADIRKSLARKEKQISGQKLR